jgi:hypothetical protein
MTACSTFSSLRKQIDTNGKGSTLRAKLHSLKGTSLVKDYMTCMRSGIKKEDQLLNVLQKKVNLEDHDKHYYNK